MTLRPRIKVFACVSLVAAMLAGVGAARADVIAVDFSGGAPGSLVLGALPGTVGWSFTVNAGITVTQLGFWDVTPTDNLATSHAVGIWTSGGTLVGSGTVSFDAALGQDDVRYSSVTPFDLAIGSYVIGAFIPASTDATDPNVGNDDRYLSGASVALSVSTPSQITYGGSLIHITDSALAKPDTTVTGNGRFGPNFQFTTATAQAPAPATLVLLASGFTALGTLAWRRRR